jgi:hypothetical protein
MSPKPSESGHALSRGAYGFRVRGIPADESQLVNAPAHWPSIELSVRVSTATQPAADYLDEDTAHLRLRSGGSLFVDRATERATFSLPAPPGAAALLHPHLAAAAVVASYWRRRNSFHAGAFVVDDGVWGLLGDKGSGKSSTLGSLVRVGVPVFCDDVLILDRELALAGPRSVDLRGDAARQLDAGEPLGVIGERERWRLALSPVKPELPLRGWIALRWASRMRVREMRGSERLGELLCHGALRLGSGPPDPGSLIELSSLPILEFSRPRGWRSMQDSLARLLDAVGG